MYVEPRIRQKIESHCLNVETDQKSSAMKTEFPTVQLQ